MIRLKRIASKCIPFKIKFYILKSISTFNKILYRITRTVFHFENKDICLTYDDTIKRDGVGAQLHRILALFALSKDLEIDYIHTAITDFSIHPLDPFNDLEKQRVFLRNLNSSIHINSTIREISQFRKISVASLNFSILYKYFIISKITRKPTLIAVSEPFGVTDSFPQIYEIINSKEYALFHSPIYLRNSNETEMDRIAIHFRWGVGGMAVQPGESKPRELPLEYYFRALQFIITEFNLQDYKVSIYTDAPKTETHFLPLSSQIKNWVNTPNFDNSRVTIKGIDLESEFRNLGYEVEVFSGGDPLFAINEMINSNYLIMSKSSLSYVSGLLNRRGIVIYPREFWHPPLSKWISFK